MAHTRKDTLARTSSWNKHLRRDGKRRQAKAERRVAKTVAIRNILCDGWHVRGEY